MRGPIPGFRRHLALSVALVAFVAGWLAYLLGLGGALPTLGHTYRLHVIAPDAAALASNARVTMAGADVGKVTAVHRQGLGAVIDVRLDDKSVTPVPVDSRATIRQRTPLGENYLQILRGRSTAMLRSGDALTMARADEPVDVDQVLTLLHGQARARARVALRATGVALAGRGDELNALLGATAQFLSTGSRVVRVLDHDRVQTARLVAQLGDVSRAVADRGDAIGELAEGARRSFDAVAAREAQTRALLRELPPTLSVLRETTTTLGQVSDGAAPTLAHLAGAVDLLDPAIRRLAPAAAWGQRVLAALGSAAPGLETTFDRLRGLAGPTAGAVPQLQASLCQLNPMLAYVRPYASDISQAIVGMNSSSNAYDATGHYIRVGAVVNEQMIPGLPPQVKNDIKLLSEAGLLHTTHLRGYDPYPLPRSIGAPTANGAIGPAGLTRTYPRVRAAC